MNKNELFRKIPKVDILLEDKEIIDLIESCSREIVMEAIRKESTKLRDFIKENDDLNLCETALQQLTSNIVKAASIAFVPNMVEVINATGTILHTNLGRAPISKRHMEQVSKIATKYSNLEYDLKAGGRGERYAHFEELLCEITGAEAAMAVNNNAAAVMLIMNAMGKDKEIIVSRGELVEVGGKFRIPDVMELSKAKLVEIGTTNKTHLSDYEDNINENTAALMKVHTSNYRILGFTHSVEVNELVEMAKTKDIPVIEDLGSGVLVDLSKFGLTYEPTVQSSVNAGVDVVCFSGDKLLGGPQAGIIVGKKKYIDLMKKNQLTRALRIDKFTAAALEAVLLDYKSLERAIENIPVLNMIATPLDELERKAGLLYQKMIDANMTDDLEIKVIDCESQIGGGSLPLERMDSKAIAIKPKNISTPEYEKAMRMVNTPIVARVTNDEVILDVRTLDEEQFDEIVDLLKGI